METLTKLVAVASRVLERDNFSDHEANLSYGERELLKKYVPIGAGCYECDSCNSCGSGDCNSCCESGDD